MPFASNAQRKFMHAKHPGIAKRFEAETPKGKKLPEHVGPMQAMHDKMNRRKGR